MVWNKIFSKLRMFRSKLRKSLNQCMEACVSCFYLSLLYGKCVKIFIMNPYISKELHNDQEYYWPTTYRAEAAVVSNCTSIGIAQSLRVPAPGYESWSPDSIFSTRLLETLKDKHSIFKTVDYYSTIPRKIVSLSKKVNLPQNRQLAQF